MQSRHGMLMPVGHGTSRSACLPGSVQDLAYGTAGVLGHGPTWPQAAARLPSYQPPAPGVAARGPVPGPAPGAATSDGFDWEGDRSPRLPMEDLVIYELHVRGFTAHASSGVAGPGTFSGVEEKLDYLQRLGVNCIELMPVHEFNELEYYVSGLHGLPRLCAAGPVLGMLPSFPTPLLPCSFPAPAHTHTTPRRRSPNRSPSATTFGATPRWGSRRPWHATACQMPRSSSSRRDVGVLGWRLGL